MEREVEIQGDAPPIVTRENTRLDAIDITRGFIMVVMAIDHCRDAVGDPGTVKGYGINGEIYHSQPYSSEMPFSLFLTRYITHIAAPGFFFLMGVGMAMLYASRFKKRWSHFKIVKHLIIRGLILIILEYTVMFVAWKIMLLKRDWESYFGSSFSVTQGVLFALGFAMVAISFLVPLYWQVSFGSWNPFRKCEKENVPGENINSAEEEEAMQEDIREYEISKIGCGRTRSLGWIGFIMFAIIGYSVDSFIIMSIPEGGSSLSENFLVGFLFFPVRKEHYFAYYAVVNWICVTMLGFVFGHLLLERKWRSRVIGYCFIVGLMLLALFPILRMSGCYFTLELPGSTYWKNSLMDFLYIIKYPPSMLFVMFGVGVVLIVLSASHHILIIASDSPSKWVSALCYPVTEILLNFGKASLFFYLLHVWWFAIVGLFVNGLDLAGVYVIWGISLTPLYLLCLYYGRFKHQTAPDSIWRFF